MNLAAILAATVCEPAQPSAEDLASFAHRCRVVDLPELGHLLHTAPTRAHAVVAEQIATERLAAANRARSSFNCPRCGQPNCTHGLRGTA
ncbi:MAG: hypothetical protein WAT39_01865 [Planctomycetota bacterium]